MAKRRIGLSPVNTQHIRQFASEDLKNYEFIEDFNGSECDQARRGAATDFLIKELKFKEHEIDIASTKLAPTEKASILWIECHERFIKSIRYKARKVCNKNVNLIIFIPSMFWQRKQQLIDNCKEAQKANPRL